MIRTPLKWVNIRQHIAYSWWAYVLMAAVMLFGWQMAYRATEYVPPPEKTLHVTIAGDYVSSTVLEYYEQKAYEEFPEMESITFENIPLSIAGEGDYSGYTKLSVVIAVGEGDVYLLNRELLTSFASMQAFRPLDEDLQEGGVLYGIFTEEDLEGGTFVAEEQDYDEETTGEEHIYGISAARLYGLLNQGVDTRDLYIACTSYTQNAEYALKMIAWLGEQTEEEPPAWLEELEPVMDEETKENLPEIG